MNVLDISESSWKRAEELRIFAERPENWYYIGETPWIPGDRDEFVFESGTIRAVFTWTKVGTGQVFRHMSVSNATNYPQPFVVWTLAHWFGFKGAEPDDQGIVQKPGLTWRIGKEDGVRAIVVQEEVVTPA